VAGYGTNTKRLTQHYYSGRKVEMTTQTPIEQASAKIITTTDAILKSVAEAFPDVGMKGFEYYVQYVYADGVAQIACALFLFAMTFMIMIGVVKVAKKPGLEEIEGAIPALIGTVVAFCLITASFDCLSKGLVRVIAPEGAVIAEIVSGVKGGQ